MKTKNLIKDILTYLKENDEARERFNKGYFKKIYKSSGVFGNKKTFENDSVFYGGNKIDDLKSEKGYLALHAVELQHFLLHALSSPQGKPICGFLEEKVIKKENIKCEMEFLNNVCINITCKCGDFVMEACPQLEDFKMWKEGLRKEGEVFLDLEYRTQNRLMKFMEGIPIKPINHASTLFNLLTKEIGKGKSFDEVLIKLNKKYNEIV